MKNSQPVLAEASALMEKLDPDPVHARQVCSLARQLFRQLQGLHGLGEDRLVLLEAAALLHDIGWSRAENGSAHHKHSSDLIREHSWVSLDAVQVDWVAQIARYHRKALPKLTHRPFFRLVPDQRRELLGLSALLRVADALDRSHRSVIRSLDCRLEEGNCRLGARVLGCVGEENRALEKKRDLFELHFSVKMGTIFAEEDSIRLEHV